MDLRLTPTTTLRTTLAALVALALLAADAPAQAKLPEPSSLRIPAELKPLMRVYTDGKGRFLIAADKSKKRVGRLAHLRGQNIYFGSAKKLYRVRTYNTSSRRGVFYIIADPRRRVSKLTVDQKQGPMFHCDQTLTKLRILDGEATRRFLAKATLRDALWRHEPHLLARTALGKYFYVDRHRNSSRPGTSRRKPTKLENLRGFRLWRGRRGRMKRVRLKDVVVDAAGQVFLAKRGSLHVKVRLGRFNRLSIQNVRWLNARSKTYTPLIRVPIVGVKASWVLIYRDLGPYAGLKLGLPCDVW
jgi:hypothetical protein